MHSPSSPNTLPAVTSKLVSERGRLHFTNPPSNPMTSVWVGAGRTASQFGLISQQTTSLASDPSCVP